MRTKPAIRCVEHQGNLCDLSRVWWNDLQESRDFAILAEERGLLILFREALYADGGTRKLCAGSNPLAGLSPRARFSGRTSARSNGLSSGSV